MALPQGKPHRADWGFGGNECAGRSAEIAYRDIGSLGPHIAGFERATNKNGYVENRRLFAQPVKTNCATEQHLLANQRILAEPGEIEKAAEPVVTNKIFHSIVRSAQSSAKHHRCGADAKGLLHIEREYTAGEIAAKGLYMIHNPDLAVGARCWKCKRIF